MSRKNFLSKSKSQIMFTFKMIWLSPEKSIKKYFAGWWLVRLSINYCYDYHHHHQYLTITLVFFGCLVFLVKVTLDRLLSLKSFSFLSYFVQIFGLSSNSIDFFLGKFVWWPSWTTKIIDQFLNILFRLTEPVGHSQRTTNIQNVFVNVKMVVYLFLFSLIAVYFNKNGHRWLVYHHQSIDRLIEL